MKEFEDDIFHKLSNSPYAWEECGICVTTNGIVKNDGSLVMGKGIALTFAKIWTTLPKEFGLMVSMYGNRVFHVECCYDTLNGYIHDRARNRLTHVFSFPTKYHYADDSCPKLIEQSAKDLVKLTEHYKLKQVFMTRPGCGNGRLDWQNVKPILEKYFDDKYIVVSKP